MSYVFQSLSALSRPSSAFSRGKLLFIALGIVLFSTPLVPAHAGAPKKALESVRLNSGMPVRFKTPLEAGELFLLKADGAVTVGTVRVDAEGDGTVSGQDGVVVTDTGSAAALPGKNAPLQAVRRGWLGVSPSSHTYYMIVDGAGRPPSFRLLTGRAQTGKGAITISAFRLSPAPALLPPLETIQVPVLERTVATSLTTRPSALYLLQCSGSGRVGGGGLGQGDADYMDYQADGTGAVDIGDANTDYGLGVDEADQSRSPRRYKWGAWRKDHTYYLLFVGTGQPIHFFFYDVKGGYGDNSPTDTLTVKVFPVP